MKQINKDYRMSPDEKILWEKLNSVDNMELRQGGGIVTSGGVGVGMSAQAGNPLFRSQFDIELLTVYSAYDIDIDSGTNLLTFLDVSNPFSHTAANIPEAIKNRIMAPLFGNADFAAGFARTKELMPLSNWKYGEPVIVKGSSLSHVLPIALSGGNHEAGTFLSRAVQDGFASTGDMILPVYYNTDVPVLGGTTASMWMGEVVIKCTSVAYGTLLAAINSDRFTINMIRYTVEDESKTSQFANQFSIIKQSLFGKLSTDKVSPNMGKFPNQYQKNIVDLGINKAIDKESVIATYINFDTGKITLSIFVATTDKIK